MLAQIRTYTDRVDALTLRERAIILGGVLTLLFLGWYAWLMEPLMAEEKALGAELAVRRGQFEMLNDQFVKLTESLKEDPLTVRRAQLAALRAEEKRIQEDLRMTTVNLVTPELMPDLLRAVLKSSSGLTLVKLSGLGSTPLLEQSGKADKGAKTDATLTAGTPEGAYKHGIQIDFRGDYFSTLEYLRRLEGLEWKFFWDSVSFSVGQYPDATASVRVFTLSLDRDWIGT